MTDYKFSAWDNIFFGLMILGILFMGFLLGGVVVKSVNNPSVVAFTTPSNSATEYPYVVYAYNADCDTPLWHSIAAPGTVVSLDKSDMDKVVYSWLSVDGRNYVFSPGNNTSVLVCQNANLVPNHDYDIETVSESN